MPKAVWRICPACGEPTTGAEVLADEQMLVCDLCGQATPFALLPPLLFVTGASGAGKTTLYMELVGKVEEAILIDADLLWGVNPAHDDPASGYRQYHGLILHMAERLARNGRPVVIEGSCMPEQFENIGERWYFSKTAYLAVVCSDEELIRRLKDRPAWRNSLENLDTMVTWNRGLREGAFDTTPPMSVIDTTDRSVAESAAELHLWIKEQASEPSR
jgi:hypothetical protein